MTSPNLLSDALRQYQDLCVKPAPPEALQGTWRVHSEWVEAHLSQDALVALYLALLYELDPAPEGLEDALLDACEVVWYACSEASLKKVEDAIDEKCRVDDPERYKLRQAVRAKAETDARARAEEGAQPLAASGGGSENSTR